MEGTTENKNVRNKIAKCKMLNLNDLNSGLKTVKTLMEKTEDIDMTDMPELKKYADILQAFKSVMISHIVCYAKLQQLQDKTVNQLINELIKDS